MRLPSSRSLLSAITESALLVAAAAGVFASGWVLADGPVRFIHSFNATTEGAGPYGRLLEGPDNSLYGVLSDDESGSRDGAIFRVQKDGTGFTVLKAMQRAVTGRGPHDGLVWGGDNALYGTAPNNGPGGAGTLFTLQPDGSGFTVLKAFSGAVPEEGWNPYAGLILGGDGKLYGSAMRGGPNDNNFGVLFRINRDGTGYEVIKTFQGTDGANPWAPLLQLPDGTLIGTTMNGGSFDKGTLFRIQPGGSGFMLLHEFNGADGAQPQGALLLATDSRIYGTAAFGGSQGRGLVYRTENDGSGFSVYADVNDFSGQGSDPYGSLVQYGSNLYGVMMAGGTGAGAVGAGTLFRVSLDDAGLRAVYSFDGVAGGYGPSGGLSDSFYGLTHNGGPGGATGAGVLYSLDVTGLTFPVIARQPIGRNVPPGGSLTLNVAVTGLQPIQYQWRKNGVAIDGATSSALRLESVQPTDWGTYDVLVANPMSGLVSDPAIVYVTDQAFRETLGAQPAYLGSGGGIRLGTGKVVFAGSDISGTTMLIETFDPDTETFTAGPGLHVARIDPAVSGVRDDGLLIAGGNVTGSGYVPTTELYDAATDTVSVVAAMHQARVGHSATMLADGRVLVVGGNDNHGIPANAEIYDAGDDTWTLTSPPGRGRSSHSAVLLTDGRVLIAGGQTLTEGSTASAEIFDPATGQFTATGDMLEPLISPSLIVLPDGRVLLCGGFVYAVGPTPNAEYYDPATGVWSPAGIMGAARNNDGVGHTADGRILMVGGATPAEVFDPATGAFDWVGNDDFAGGTRPVVIPIADRTFIAGGGSFSGSIFAPPPPAAIEIIEQPEDQEGVDGDTVGFSVFAVGTEPITYQWMKDGVDIDGATDPDLDLEFVDDETVGVYQVRITNPAGTVLSDPATFTLITPPEINSITPSQAAAGGDAFTLAIEGDLFTPDSVVRWNGADRPTTFVDSMHVTAEIPAEDLAVSGSITTVLVTVFDPSTAESDPVSFLIVASVVGETSSSTTQPGGEATASTAPTDPDSAGVAATLSHVDGDGAAAVTAATYTGNPTGQEVFDVGGGFVDLQVTGAGPSDSMTAQFYYPSTVTGTIEAGLSLLYFDGSAWVAVRSSGDADPDKDTTDNLDGSVSGGRFTAVFDQTSTPSLDGLSGTVFVATLAGPAVPVITWAPASPITYGTPLGAAQLNATSDVAGTFTYSPAAGTVLTAGANRVLSVTFQPDDAERYLPTTASVSITVAKASLTVTADNATKLYGAAIPAFTAHYDGFVNGDTAASLSRGARMTTTAKRTSGVGSYPIQPSGAASPNYVFVYAPGTLTVNPAPLTITADDKQNVYGSALPTLTAHYDRLLAGDGKSDLDSPVVLTTAATPSSPVGTYPITASGASDANYVITFVSGTMSVIPHPLTIKAQNKSKSYGDATPTLTLVYTGLVNGDTSASLTSPGVATTTATASSPVGTYPITASGASSPNYQIEYLGGTLTVDRASLSITATDLSKTYGAAIPALTYTFDGFVNGDSEASLTTGVAIGTTGLASSDVGNYPITVGGAASPNYVIHFHAGTLTVTKAALVITADNQTRSVGAPNPTLTASYDGFVNGDTVATLDIPVTLTTTAKLTSPAGNYVIKASAARDSNYTITFVSGTMTVVP